MSNLMKQDFWPAPLRHCGTPLVAPTDEYITIAEVSSESVDGFAGNRLFYTAMVPLDEVNATLKAVGGIGHGVFSASGYPLYSGKRDFWIPAPDGKTQYETLINTWDNHNKIVLLPDNALLDRFELIPRVVENGNIFWDDLDGPVYDVVRVIPISSYSTENGFTTARIVVRRDYLEDYLSQKEVAAIATYFDERFSCDDPDVAALIKAHSYNFSQGGRELWFKDIKINNFNQLSQVWACALVLIPKAKPISDPEPLELQWPDRSSPIKGGGRHGSFQPMERAFVRDEVLAEYEIREEFEISPEHGYVSYDNRWSVSYCRRSGRNHIELELRKLYEGAPFPVIQHYNLFAIKSEIAEKDLKTYGSRHVGIRAKELVYAFLQLTSTISGLSDEVNLAVTQEEVGYFNTDEITYQGW